MELAGWTNDRLSADRLHRLPQGQWVYGRPNSSVIMAAFLHAAPDGMRFNGPELGAWYASKEIATAAAEVGHHLRREAIARNVPSMNRTYRAYSASSWARINCPHMPPRRECIWKAAPLPLPLGADPPPAGFDHIVAKQVDAHPDAIVARCCVQGPAHAGE